MSDTRQAWKPWRANTRTAAARIWRRFCSEFFEREPARPSRERWVLKPPAPGPAVGVGAAVGERRQRRANPLDSRQVGLGEDVALAVGGLGQDDPPRVHDHRPSARVLPGGVGPVLVGGDHVQLVLDRPGPQQDLPVVAGGGEREGGRDGDQLGAPDGEDPVQLREAQVVADRQPQTRVPPGPRQHDLLTGKLELGLPVAPAPDFHVEHVELAVDGPDLPLGVDVKRGVGELLLALRALQQRPRHQLHAQLAGQPPGPPDGRAVERLGGRPQLLLGAHRGPLLGQHDQLGTG